MTYCPECDLPLDEGDHGYCRERMRVEVRDDD